MGGNGRARVGDNSVGVRHKRPAQIHSHASGPAHAPDALYAQTVHMRIRMRMRMRVESVRSLREGGGREANFRSVFVAFSEARMKKTNMKLIL